MELKTNISDAAVKGFQYVADNSGRTIVEVATQTLEDKGVEYLHQIPMSAKQSEAIEAIKSGEVSADDVIALKL